MGQEAHEAQGQIANEPTTLEYPGSPEIVICYSTPAHVRTSWLETLNLSPLYLFLVTQFPQACYSSRQSQGYQVYFVTCKSDSLATRIAPRITYVQYTYNHSCTHTSADRPNATTGTGPLQLVTALH